jgi:hypothetical protein
VYLLFVVSEISRALITAMIDTMDDQQKFAKEGYHDRNTFIVFESCT